MAQSAAASGFSGRDVGEARVAGHYEEMPSQVLPGAATRVVPLRTGPVPAFTLVRGPETGQIRQTVAANVEGFVESQAWPTAGEKEFFRYKRDEC